MMQVLHRRNIVIIIITIILIFSGYLLFDNLTFRLKSTDPPLDEVATSATAITFTFSQPIKSIGDVIIDGKIVNDNTISDKSITVSLSTIELIQDKTYSIKLTNVASKWFNNSLNNLTYIAKATYVDFADLSEDQQKQQINSSSSNQVDDPFLNSIFPIVKEKYQIEADKSVDEKMAYLTVTFFDEVPDYDNDGKIKQLPNDIAETYRDEVIKTIKSLGGSPQNYLITYSNKYLNTKYSDNYHD